jgi:hypothetical protein
MEQLVDFRSWQPRPIYSFSSDNGTIVMLCCRRTIGRRGYWSFLRRITFMEKRSFLGPET